MASEQALRTDGLPLYVWPFRARTYLVDPRTGAVSRGPRRRPGVAWGFGSRCAGHLVGLYRRPSDDHIVLSAGGRLLDLDAGPVETHRRSLFVGSALTLVGPDGSPMRLLNGTPGRLQGLVDPAWDDDEDESEDFLLFLSRSTNDAEWRDHVRQSWGVPRGDLEQASP